MPRLQIICDTTLTASVDERVISGLLLPYGQEGRTNKGRITASASTLTLPSEPVPLNVEHDAKRRVGKSVSFEETTEGIYASFRILPTRDGDDALVEIEEGLRACLSIEVDEPVTRGGRLLAGIVVGAALVAEPAFPDARLAASLVEDLGDLPDEDPDTSEEDEANETDTDTATDPADGTVVERTETQYVDEFTGDLVTTVTTTTIEKKDTPMPQIQAARARRTPTASQRLTAASTSTADYYRLLAGAATGNRQMQAALADVVPGDILGIEQPQYVGELWDGKAYQRQIIPCFNHADLESFEVTGWRWKTRPTVAKYTGNKADVPSAKIETEPVKISAERLAGAHDIDRKFKDFGATEFWAAYHEAMTESYARLSDAEVLALVKEGATKVTAGEVPAGISTGLVYIVDGMLSVMKETDTIPDTAFVSLDLWRGIILTKADNALAYLQTALGLEDGSLESFRIKPISQLDPGKVLVTCKPAVTVHELGGGAPIRVDALDVAKGGIDEGVFGYYAVNIHDKGGLALVSQG